MSDTNAVNINSNQPVLQRSEHVTSLATSTILVSVDVRAWSATKQDRGISHEVTSAKKADPESGRFIKHLLAKDPDHKRILNYRQTIYNWLQREAYDWNGPQRALPVVRLPGFMQKFHYHKAEYLALVDTFLAKYPDIMTRMAFAQGEMFNRMDYPTVDQVRSKFSIELFTSEIPEGDFRCQVAQDLADDLFSNYDRQAKRIIEGILDKQCKQLINVLSSLSHCCDTENTINTGGEAKTKRRKIYDSTVQRALELCDTFSQYNLTSNTALEEARSQLAAVMEDVTADALRANDNLRDTVKQEVDEILSKFRAARPVDTEDSEDDESSI